MLSAAAGAMRGDGTALSVAAGISLPRAATVSLVYGRVIMPDAATALGRAGDIAIGAGVSGRCVHGSSRCLEPRADDIASGRRGRMPLALPRGVTGSAAGGA